jgi:hypothetical protein
MLLKDPLIMVVIAVVDSGAVVVEVVILVAVVVEVVISVVVVGPEVVVVEPVEVSLPNPKEPKSLFKLIYSSSMQRILNLF